MNSDAADDQNTETDESEDDGGLCAGLVTGIVEIKSWSLRATPSRRKSACLFPNIIVEEDEWRAPAPVTQEKLLDVVNHCLAGMLQVPQGCAQPVPTANSSSFVWVAHPESRAGTRPKKANFFEVSVFLGC